MDDPNWYLIIYFFIVVFFVVYARYYNILRSLSRLRGAMLLGLIEKNQINPEKIEQFESKLLSLQIGRLFFIVPLLSSYHFLKISSSFSLFLLVS